jgi:putative ABC transport system substrate-binding protein
MRRREFITNGLVGGLAVAWPFAARGQQPALPVVGFLHASSADSYAKKAAAFAQGLHEAGYIDGQNVAIAYRWADDRYDRLPSLAADLVRQKVAVIAAAPVSSAVAAHQATRTIPIVFEFGADPVRLGLVSSLNRPGGNVTGIVNLDNIVLPKRVELMRELLPNADHVALLLNPDNPASEYQIEDVRAVQKLLGLRLEILHARKVSDIEATFAKLRELQAGALIVAPDAFFVSRSSEIAALALRYSMPTSHETEEFVTAGGLISYGTDLAEAYRLAGVHTGRILKGDKPAELPVQQATKIGLYINLRTAKALGLTIPPMLLARADEVIE